MATAGEPAQMTENLWEPMEELVASFGWDGLIDRLEDVLWAYVEYSMNPIQVLDKDAWACTYMLR